MSRTLFDDMTAPGVINLRIGAPSNYLLGKSAQLLKNSAQICLSRADAVDLMTYGPLTGADDFREAISKFLSDQYKQPVDKDDIVETAGATSGLQFISSVFFSPGDILFAEEFSYFLGANLLTKASRLNLQPVAVDENGINPDDLERSIVESHLVAWQQWRPTPIRPYWAMVYLIPQFQNPTGTCLSPERSQKMIQLARKYSLLIVCDDVYNLLYFPRHYPNQAPPTRLFAYDRKDDPDYCGGNVISNGSFSKYFGPGVRCGWLEAPQRVITTFDKTDLLRSGGAINHAMAGLLTGIIERGELTKHIEETRLINQGNCSAILEVFNSRIPFIECQEPTGGYFLWVKLPKDFPISSEALLEKCLNEYKVNFFPGNIFSMGELSKGDKLIRISFSLYEREELVKAANLFCDAIISVVN